MLGEPPISAIARLAISGQRNNRIIPHVNAANSRAQLVGNIARPCRVHRDAHRVVQLCGGSGPPVTSESDPSATGYRLYEAAVAVDCSYSLVTLVSYEDSSGLIDGNSNRVGELGLASG
jgi:hypothetical protein